MYLLYLSCSLALVSLCYGAILPLIRDANRAICLIAVTVGGQDLLLELDTGSPETWLVTPSTACLLAGIIVPCSTEFGQFYTPGPSYKDAPSGSTGDITYADRSWVEGNFGYDIINIGGIDVYDQRIITASYTSISYAQPASGLLGLGYPLPFFENQASPAIRDFRVRKAPKAKVSSSAVEGFPPAGSPFISTLFGQNLLAPFFAVALSRDLSNQSFGGVFTVSERPYLSNIWINASTDAVASTAIIPTNYLSNLTALEFYTINVDGIIIINRPFDPSTAVTYRTTDSLYILDTGSTSNYIPALYASYINSLFQPPATYDKGTATWYVECDAIPPRIGFNIMGVEFFLHEADYIHEISSGTCISTIQEALQQGENTLGQPFLRNVYLEIYRGDWEGHASDSVWLAARENYLS